MQQLAPWRVEARNLPEHAGNRIHTDEGARQAGFPAALVAGVTTYAYLTHPLVAAWGTAWLLHGGGEVRFSSPVFAGDAVDCVPVPRGADLVVEACVDGCPPRATLHAVEDAGPPGSRRAGEVLEPVRVRLVDEWGSGYGARAGDDLELYAEQRLVHPAVWPALANHVVHEQVARGPWIHLRSRIAHHSLVQEGVIAMVRATVVERFDRPTGERAVLDVEVEVAGEVVATVEHEAIVALAARQ